MDALNGKTKIRGIKIGLINLIKNELKRSHCSHVNSVTIPRRIKPIKLYSECAVLNLVLSTATNGYWFLDGVGFIP